MKNAIVIGGLSGIPTSVVGRLAENSAQMRYDTFKEDLSVLKGRQLESRILEDADIPENLGHKKNRKIFTQRL